MEDGGSSTSSSGSSVGSSSGYGSQNTVKCVEAAAAVAAAALPTTEESTKPGGISINTATNAIVNNSQSQGRCLASLFLKSFCLLPSSICDNSSST